MPDLGTRELILEVDGDDFSDAVSSVKITSGDKEAGFISFLEARSGGAREYSLAITLKQNTSADSLWYFMWNAAGTTVPVTIWPNGGSTESATTPKITGSVVISEADDLLGGEADKSPSARFTSTVSWLFTAKPIMDITP